MLKEHDEPRPGPREVLIRMRANSLNFRELMVLRGNYPLPVKPDVVMGADGAGEVVAVGLGVSRVKAKLWQRREPRGVSYSSPHQPCELALQPGT
jgi:NADPH:quinone reductase-like Zn-dependent oxidoreductase